MTQHEAFKKRVRARMAKTGERYGAARRSLLAAGRGAGGLVGTATAATAPTATTAPTASPAPTPWVARPELSDDRIAAATGRAWDEWRALIDDAGLRDAGHSAIAAWLVETHGVDGWWAQSVTVGYERITGLRLPGQMPDGTFTVGVSRTVPVAADELRAMLLDARDDLFPGVETQVRSRPGSRSPRLAFPEGVVLFALDPVPDGRTKVSVAHEKLPSAELQEPWREYWRGWLAALADG